MRNIEPDHVPKTMDMFLILLESYTLYGQYLFQELCNQGGHSA